MSATGMTIPLSAAQRIAAEVLADLAPYCERIAVAGSVRRGKPQVADLEIVAIPKWEQSGGLFATEPVNLLYERLQDVEQRRYRWLKGNNPDGRYFQLALADGMQVDLFTAAPENFGWILLMRTGSSEFSHSMLARWKSCQRLGKDQKGSVDGRLVTAAGNVVPTPEEIDVFRACHVEWIAPEQRNGRLFF